MSLQLIEAAKALRFDHATGWPERFTVNQAIALQTWHEGIAPKAWGSKADDLRKLFHLEHSKGAVEVTTTSRTEKVERSKNIEVTFASMHWDGVPGKRRVVHWVEDVTTTTHHITAEAFAAWLAENDIEPSRHVAAWFKSQAVDLDRRPIAPPKEWTTQSAHGLQRFEGTDAGGLVRVAKPVYWNPLPLAAACVTAKTGVPMDERALVDLVAKRGKAGTATPTIIKAVMPTDARFCRVALPGHPELFELLEGAAHRHLTRRFGPLPSGVAYVSEVRQDVVPLVVNQLLELLLRGQTEVAMGSARGDEHVFLMPYGGAGHIATIGTCGINQQDLLCLLDSLGCEAKAAAPAVTAKPTPAKETTKQRNDRWLSLVDEEERAGPKVGAQARAIRRIVEKEAEGEHKVKKGIQAAQAARANKYRESGIPTLSGKKSKPATPFDVLTKRR